jgi:hypothetical protein
VSNWIDSGGNAPRLCNEEDLGNSGPESPQFRRARRFEAPLTIGFAMLVLGLTSHLGHARDDGRYGG